MIAEVGKSNFKALALHVGLLAASQLNRGHLVGKLSKDDRTKPLPHGMTHGLHDSFVSQGVLLCSLLPWRLYGPFSVTIT